MKKEDILKIYKKSILLEGEMHFKDSLLREACEHFKIDKIEAEKMIADKHQKAKEEWVNKSIKGSNDIINYYDTSLKYVFNDLIAHHSGCGWWDTYMKCLGAAKKFNVAKCLDYGAGIGTLGILLAKKGFDITLADVSSIMQDFSKYRFRIRKLKADFIDLKKTGLPDKAYDFVVCTDVLEHVEDPKSALKNIVDSIKEGKYLYLKTYFGKSETFPMHIIHDKNIIKNEISRLGLKKIRVKTIYGSLEIFQKRLKNN